jgi:flagellar P-ring protein precursor FlgI
MRKQIFTAITIFIIAQLIISPVWAQMQVPLKNISRIHGVRENQLRGFGLVIGLNGTGDGGIDFVNRSIANALSQMGIKIDDPGNAQLDNVAAVMLTATLPPFKKQGDKIDVTVSSIGSADDLSGGILLQTPLQAGNGKVYAAAQGAITKGGAGDGRHLTTVRIPGGAIVETEVPFQFVGEDFRINLQLNNGDFTTATRAAEAINSKFDMKLARAQNSNSVRVIIPENYRNDPVRFIAIIENIRIKPGAKNKVIINERTGTVIMGDDVSVRPVAISHGDISLQVENGGGGQTGETVVLPENTNVRQIVDSLNAVGASTDAIIAILNALDRADALNAPLEIM